MKYGFVRVAAGAPNLKIADCNYNTTSIIQLMQYASKQKVEIIAFPELSLTGYTCGDLFQQKTLLNAVKEQLEVIIYTSNHEAKNLVTIVGFPLEVRNQLYNCAGVIQNGQILGIVPKTYIPNYKEFYEERWFTSGAKCDVKYVQLCDQSVPFGTDLIFKSNDVSFGIEICEDLWVPVPPSSNLALAGATILFNLSASNELVGKSQYRRDLVVNQSGKCVAGYVYVSSGMDESTSDIVFSGHSIIAENGSILEEDKPFTASNTILISEIDVEKLQYDRRRTNTYTMSDKEFRTINFKLTAAWESEKDKTFYRRVNPLPFVPKDNSLYEEIINIQKFALVKRLKHANIKEVVIGVSGGLDSTLALLITVKAFDQLNIPRKNIKGITMPGFGTTDITYDNALKLMKALGISMEEINIQKACLRHFTDIGHDPNVHNLVYENAQARERTQILMDKGFVIGTGDLSELALGWCTYNGDHMSMYSVNCSIPKTLVRHLIDYIQSVETDNDTKQVLVSILLTPISPELLPPDKNGKIAQLTEDSVGPYNLHDFFLFNMIRNGFEPQKIVYLAEIAFNGIYDRDTIKKWLKTFYQRFFNNQFKRNCVPDGPKVGSVSLSPRGDWRMPSDAVAAEWIKNLEAK